MAHQSRILKIVICSKLVCYTKHIIEEESNDQSKGQLTPKQNISTNRIVEVSNRKSTTEK